MSGTELAKKFDAKLIERYRPALRALFKQSFPGQELDITQRPQETPAELNNRKDLGYYDFLKTVPGVAASLRKIQDLDYFLAIQSIIPEAPTSAGGVDCYADVRTKLAEVVQALTALSALRTQEAALTAEAVQEGKWAKKLVLKDVGHALSAVDPTIKYVAADPAAETQEAIQLSISFDKPSKSSDLAFEDLYYDLLTFLECAERSGDKVLEGRIMKCLNALCGREGWVPPRGEKARAADLKTLQAAQRDIATGALSAVFSSTSTSTEPPSLALAISFQFRTSADLGYRSLSHCLKFCEARQTGVLQRNGRALMVLSESLSTVDPTTGELSEPREPTKAECQKFKELNDQVEKSREDRRRYRACLGVLSNQIQALTADEEEAKEARDTRLEGIATSMRECQNNIKASEQKAHISQQECATKLNALCEDPACDQDIKHVLELRVMPLLDKVKMGKPLLDPENVLAVLGQRARYKEEQRQDQETGEWGLCAIETKLSVLHLTSLESRSPLEFRSPLAFNIVPELRSLVVPKVAEIRRQFNQHLMCFNFRDSEHRDALVALNRKKPWDLDYEQCVQMDQKLSRELKSALEKKLNNVQSEEKLKELMSYFEQTLQDWIEDYEKILSDRPSLIPDQLKSCLKALSALSSAPAPAPRSSQSQRKAGIYNDVNGNVLPTRMERISEQASGFVSICPYDIFVGTLVKQPGQAFSALITSLNQALYNGFLGDSQVQELYEAACAVQGTPNDPNRQSALNDLARKVAAVERSTPEYSPVHKICSAVRTAAHEASPRRVFTGLTGVPTNQANPQAPAQTPAELQAELQAQNLKILNAFKLALERYLDGRDCPFTTDANGKIVVEQYADFGKSEKRFIGWGATCFRKEVTTQNVKTAAAMLTLVNEMTRGDRAAITSGEFSALTEHFQQVAARGALRGLVNEVSVSANQLVFADAVGATTGRLKSVADLQAHPNTVDSANEVLVIA